MNLTKEFLFEFLQNNIQELTDEYKQYLEENIDESNVKQQWYLNDPFSDLYDFIERLEKGNE